VSPFFFFLDHAVKHQIRHLRLKCLKRVRELREVPPLNIVELGAKRAVRETFHTPHLVPRLRKEVVAVLRVLQLPLQLFNSAVRSACSAQATRVQPDFAGSDLGAPFGGLSLAAVALRDLFSCRALGGRVGTG
jgi:hypothetical protein